MSEHTFHATIEDLEDFENLIEHKLSEVLKKYGAVKIKPPSNWKPIKENIEDSAEKFPFLYQKKFGKNGKYFLKYPANDSKPKTLKEFKALADKREQKIKEQFGSKSIDELENSILNNEISKENVIYGSDVELSLLDENNQTLNLNNMNDLVRRYTKKIDDIWPGISTAYCYIGSIASIFAWHTEDLNFNSISIHVCGHQKIWYVISPRDYELFESEMTKHASKNDDHKCDIPLRHKDVCFTPDFVKSLGINVTKIVQEKGDIIVTAAKGYHSGMNLGFNIAVATNFAFQSWMPCGEDFKLCSCPNFNNFKEPVELMVEKIKNIGKQQLEEFEQNSKKKNTNKQHRTKKQKSTMKKTGFSCKLCQQVLSTKSSLGQHLRTKHSKQVFYCSDCTGSEKRPYQYLHNLVDHVKSKHQRDLIDAEKKPIKLKKQSVKGTTHQCKLCKTGFKHKFSLNDHMNKVHNENVVIWKCDLCDFCSKFKKNLNKHKKNKH